MIRNTAKTLIEHENKLLLIKKKLDHVGIYYTLPGGGQEFGETMEETVLRECAEELNIKAHIKEFVCVREYISNNHEYSFLVKQVHAIEFIFKCSFEAEDEDMITHLQNDVAQIGFEWLDLPTLIEVLQRDEEGNTLKFPKTLRDFLIEYYISCSVVPYSRFKF